MKDYEHFGLRISDASGGAVIADDIPMMPAPYAWLSERARVSDAADRLVDDQMYTIALSDQFRTSEGTGLVPRAARVGHVVMLTGAMTNVNANPHGALVGTLPTGMRPSQSTVLAVHVGLATMTGNAALDIRPSGEIYLISPNYGPGYSFYLNGANFIVE